jgi:DNA-binding response OmpR family regulator
VKGEPETIVEPIRVVLATAQDPLVAALVGGALRDAGIKVVDARTQEEALLVAARDQGVSVVIVACTVPGLADAYATALRANPRLRLLVVVAMDERADLLELRLLGSDLGVRGVVAAVRAAASTPVRRFTELSHRGGWT